MTLNCHPFSLFVVAIVLFWGQLMTLFSSGKFFPSLSSLNKHYPLILVQRGQVINNNSSKAFIHVLCCRALSNVGPFPSYFILMSENVSYTNTLWNTCCYTTCILKNWDFCRRNHKTCQQLQSINLDIMGLGGLSCLKAITQRVRPPSPSLCFRVFLNF